MAEALAHATDRKGRRVVDAAVQPVKLALQRRLLYLGPSKPFVAFCGVRIALLGGGIDCSVLWNTCLLHG